jgi:hypothetical protein
MTKREIIGAICGFAAALVVVGGYGLWHHRQLNEQKQAQAAAEKQTVGDHVISLNNLSPSDDSSGSLQVGGATSLGQLGGSQPGSQGGGSGSSSSTPNFSQYDKYKDSTSGLFGEVQPGNGTELTSGHKAFITYKGWLTDGTLFDQSKTGSDGKPQAFSFVLGQHQVIPGLEEGIAGMKVGGTRLVIVPPAVGYGAQGQGPVPPNAVMVFQINLADVQ